MNPELGRYNCFTGEPIARHHDTEYYRLACVRLGREPEEAPMPDLTVHNVDDPIHCNPCDIADIDDERLAVKCGLAPEQWANLNEARRMARLEAPAALRECGDNHVPAVVPVATDESGWLKQADVARRLGTYRVAIRRLIESGELRTNGEAGHACRVDPASILAYCTRKDVTWNDDGGDL